MPRSSIVALSVLLACGADQTQGRVPSEGRAAATTRAPSASGEGKQGRRAEAGVAGSEIDARAIYNQYCVACHGVDGRGNDGLAPDYVADQTPLARSDEVLVGVIKKGGQSEAGVMPPWGDTLDDAQVQALLAYMRSTFRSETPPE